MALGNALSKALEQEREAVKRHPEPVLYQHASRELSETHLGLLKAYEVQGKLQWSTQYKPVVLLRRDEEQLAVFKDAYRKLNAEFKRFKTAAYKRGREVTIEEARKLTIEREGR